MSAFNPLFPGPVIPYGRRRCCLKEIKTFELPITGYAVTDTTLDLGINPKIYCQLPCECFVVMRVRQSIPAAADALPVNVVTPTSSSSSTVSSGAPVKKTSVVDHDNNPVVGADIADVTDIYALVDKSIGLIRFVNFRTGTAPSAPTAADASVQSLKSSK